MATLLHLDSTMNGDRSYSRRVAAEFISAWENQHPEGTTVRRDLYTRPLPHLRTEEYALGFTDPAEHSPEQQATFALRAELIAELEAADAVVISAPMYNYSIPSTLKAWLDHVIAIGRTAGSANTSVAGKPVTVISSRGGSYKPGSPNEGRDYVESYLTWVLGGAMAMDVTVITPELTMAPTVEAMASLVPQHEASLAESLTQAATRGKEIAARVSA